MNWSIAVIGGVILLPGMRKYLLPSAVVSTNKSGKGIYWIWRARHKYIKDGSSIIEDNVNVVEGVQPSGVEFKI